MVRNDIKNSSLLKTKFLIYAFNGRTFFYPPIDHLAAKNRFSRRFAWVQQGGSCACRQNEFLFKRTATNTRFGAIFSKIKCVLVQNAVQYAAKRSAFWC